MAIKSTTKIHFEEMDPAVFFRWRVTLDQSAQPRDTMLLIVQIVRWY